MVRGKNEYLYGSVRAEMVVKVEASEKRVDLYTDQLPSVLI